MRPLRVANLGERIKSYQTQVEIEVVKWTGQFFGGSLQA